MTAAPRLLVAIVWLSLATLGALPALAAASCDRQGTPLEAKALAEKAAALLTEIGPLKAFSHFMTPDGGYMPHDLYVFVFDREGRMWVNGKFPGQIGSNIAGALDQDGRPFLLNAMRRAEREGSAWVEYLWYNPCSGRPMPKSTHIIRVGSFFVAVGAYGTLEA